MKIAKASKSIEDVKNQVKEKFDAIFELDIQEVEDLFLNPEIKEIDEEDVNLLLSKRYDKDGLLDFMCKKHDFSQERMTKLIERMAKTKTESRQKRMGGWL